MGPGALAATGAGSAIDDVLGGGTPFFPALDVTIRLRLAETRTFPSGVIYARYEPRAR